ncbi:MAG: hypothetical protein MUE49_12685 [Rhodospirillales bacterium]|nr:hypothetical protein [Rhodospirillales bacterium]
MAVDLVTVFSIIVFSLSWFYWSRTPVIEPLVRLFFGTLMVLGASVGILGFILRLYTKAAIDAAAP